MSESVPVEMLESLAKDIGPDLGMFIVQWAAQQQMGVEQEALSTLVVRRVREKLDALIAETREESHAEARESGLLMAIRESIASCPDNDQGHAERYGYEWIIDWMVKHNYRPVPAEAEEREAREMLLHCKMALRLV